MGKASSLAKATVLGAVLMALAIIPGCCPSAPGIIAAGGNLSQGVIQKARIDVEKDRDLVKKRMDAWSLQQKARNAQAPN